MCERTVSLLAIFYIKKFKINKLNEIATVESSVRRKYANILIAVVMLKVHVNYKLWNGV